MHPHGLKLLDYYATNCDRKSKAPSMADTDLANAIATKLATVINKKKSVISIALRRVLKESWIDKGDGNFSVAGEKEESSASGDPDAVIRMNPLSGQVDQQKLVMLVIERTRMAKRRRLDRLLTTQA
jgi:phenylpyruvate tautomerase PptA (4-oxalocrotonate tautomerase family)